MNRWTPDSAYRNRKQPTFLLVTVPMAFQYNIIWKFVPPDLLALSFVSGGGLVVREQSWWLAGDSEFESCSPLEMADCLECLCIYPSIPVP